MTDGFHGADFVSLYITAPGAAEAESMARTLVAERLVACVNIVPGAVSIYRWEGELQRDHEVVMFAKTRRTLVERVRERVEALHGYDVPCVVALPIVGGNPDYLRWLAEETADD